MTSRRTIPVFALLALGVGGLTTARAQTAEQPALVTVAGVGVIRRAPDVAYVVFVAESRDESPRVAQRDAAAAMTAVHDRLRKEGVAEEALRTLAYDLSPGYDFVDGRRILRGYTAINRLQVRVDQVDRVGELIDAGVVAGATAIEGLRFDVKDRAAAEREALRVASADAWARAQAAAAGVGRSVDRVVRLEESGASSPTPGRDVLMMRADASQAEAPPPIVPGDVEIRARVILTAALK